MTEVTHPKFQEKNAILSVFNKEGIVDFARALVGLGWHLWSSGGTAKTIAAAGLPVRDVAELVGEAILDHRVVTLSREVHAALLARPIDVDLAVLQELGVPFIDLVCVDFYPLMQAIDAPGATFESVVELTDIGGPTMVRSAAKGGRIVIADTNDRGRVLELLQNGGVLGATRRELSAKAEWIVSRYCFVSAWFLSEGRYNAILGKRATRLNYGENPAQGCAEHYVGETNDLLALHRFIPVVGSNPSFNNLGDIDAGLETLTRLAAAYHCHDGFTPPIAIGIKHRNPCGTAVDDYPHQAMRKMVTGDPRALFGGVVITNFDIDETVARELVYRGTTDGRRRILDVVVAPHISEEAADLLNRKEGKCRMLENSALRELDESTLNLEYRFVQIRGGYLVQSTNPFVLDFKDNHLELVCGKDAPSEIKGDLLVAWAVNQTSKSNTITIAKDGMVIGNGAGQQDRVGAAELAIKRARDQGHSVVDSVAVSDSFFPFPDGLEVLAEAGVRTILATSGSKNDQLVLEAARRKGVTLFWIPDRLGRGFCH